MLLITMFLKHGLVCHCMQNLLSSSVYIIFFCDYVKILHQSCVPFKLYITLGFVLITIIFDIRMVVFKDSL